jgi:hypothetical protein
LGRAPGGVDDEGDGADNDAALDWSMFNQRSYKI